MPRISNIICCKCYVITRLCVNFFKDDLTKPLGWVITSHIWLNCALNSILIVLLGKRGPLLSVNSVINSYILQLPWQKQSVNSVINSYISQLPCEKLSEIIQSYIIQLCTDLYYNIVGVVVAMVIPTMHDKPKFSHSYLVITVAK